MIFSQLRAPYPAGAPDHASVQISAASVAGIQGMSIVATSGSFCPAALRIRLFVSAAVLSRRKVRIVRYVPAEKAADPAGNRTKAVLSVFRRSLHWMELKVVGARNRLACTTLPPESTNRRSTAFEFN